MSLVVLQRILLHINCMLSVEAPHFITIFFVYHYCIIPYLYCYNFLLFLSNVFACFLHIIIIIAFVSFLFYFILFWMKEGWLWDWCWHLPIVMVINWLIIIIITLLAIAVFDVIYITIILYYPIFDLLISLCTYLLQKKLPYSDCFVKCQQEVFVANYFT